MSDDEKPNAQIFRKPIHHKATRKVSALPQLLEKSQRPDGEKAQKVETSEPSIEPASEEIDDGGLFDDMFDD